MSSGERFQLAYAGRVAGHLLSCLDWPKATVVGSVRRGRPDVGDIEFIAPLPEPGTEDSLWVALEERFYDPRPDNIDFIIERRVACDDLFGSAGDQTAKIAHARKTRYGSVRQGLKPGFKHARLVLNLHQPRVTTIPVEFYRYVDGPTGNRGWIEMIRTGDADFSHRMVMRWQAIRGERDKPGSVDGFPIDRAGNPIPVPDEDAVWSLLRMKPVEPDKRVAAAMPLEVRS